MLVLKTWELASEQARLRAGCFWLASPGEIRLVAKLQLCHKNVNISCFKRGPFFFGRALYGSEVNGVTGAMIRQLRKQVGYALWHNKGPRNRTAFLLIYGKGNADPAVSAAVRIMSQWKRMVEAGHLDRVEDIWDQVPCSRYYRGPLSLVAYYGKNTWVGYCPRHTP